MLQVDYAADVPKIRKRGRYDCTMKCSTIWDLTRDLSNRKNIWVAGT
jgi:hypothetical protein